MHKYNFFTDFSNTTLSGGKSEVRNCFFLPLYDENGTFSTKRIRRCISIRYKFKLYLKLIFIQTSTLYYNVIYEQDDIGNYYARFL